VYGTLTFDLDNANPAFSSGAVGGYQDWTSAERSGSAFGLPPSSNYVFSMTVFSGSTLLYSTGAPGTYSSQSSIEGALEQLYTGSETQTDDSTGLNSRTSSLYLSGLATNSVYQVDGLPNISAATGPQGSFGVKVNGVSGSATFGIVRETPAPVPLPAAAWLLISGLGGLGAFARRKAA
jgi:hypothetical protein